MNAYLTQSRRVREKIDRILLSDWSNPVVPACFYMRDFLRVTYGLNMMCCVGRVWTK